MNILVLLACASLPEYVPGSCQIEPAGNMALDDAELLGFTPLQVVGAVASSYDVTMDWRLDSKDGLFWYVSEPATFTLSFMPWTTVERVRLKDVDRDGCSGLFDGSHEGDAMMFRSMLVDLEATESANHMGGSVSMFVMEEATWTSVGFYSDFYEMGLYSAGDFLVESLINRALWSSVDDDDWTVSGVSLLGSMTSLGIRIGIEGPIEGAEGTVGTGGADAALDLGLDPDASIFP